MPEMGAHPHLFACAAKQFSSVPLVLQEAQIYALSDYYRKIYRRIRIDGWIELANESKGLPIPSEVVKGNAYSDACGFTDLSAFSENDMYAVGGEGDVWRFDGAKWHNCALPTKCLFAIGLLRWRRARLHNGNERKCMGGGELTVGHG
ncbi:hypothetical protein F2P44_32025 [Massilia sp. CCM 8695]|uniref:Uncharacterized protein n=1 Tax=Massilia frigida TaxID=2609281 RepID=A0ABX0NGL8_9BURK|nr:hypothetical protein [Massilia frigida]NHZ83863.1 hypothetical protein [Massilia frigida]